MEIEIGNFAHVNLYTDDVDLPQIKPRTVNNRNEFYIEIPGDMLSEITKEEARRAIGRQVKEEYQQKYLSPLEQQLRQKKAILEKKRMRLNELRRKNESEMRPNRYNPRNGPYHNRMGAPRDHYNKYGNANNNQQRH